MRRGVLSSRKRQGIDVTENPDDQPEVRTEQIGYATFTWVGNHQTIEIGIDDIG